MAKTIFLIRHAQSANNALPEPQRVPDPDITGLGHEQSKATALWLTHLQADRMYCSAFLRSLRTAEHIAHATGLIPEIRHDLFEKGGCYAGYHADNRIAKPGMGRGELSRRFPGWRIDQRIEDHGWWYGRAFETDEEAKARAHSIRRWMEKSQELENQKSILVIHADLKRLLLEALFSEQLWTQAIDPFNTSITQLVFSEGSWQLHCYNSISHLPMKWIT